MNRYVVGNTVRLGATLLDDKDLPLSAAAVRCAILAPGQLVPVELTVTPDPASNSRVIAFFSPSVPGVHSYAFTNESPKTNGERAFLVLPRAVPGLP